MPIQQYGVKVKRLYKREGGTNTEIKLLHDSNGNIIHKRTNITYASEDYTLISSETKTWGVEYLNPPTPPTKRFHTFKHWANNTYGIIGTNTLAPIGDAVYRPVYDENYVAEISVDWGSWSNYEWDGNYTWNGVPAFIITWTNPGMSITGLKNTSSLAPVLEGRTVEIRPNSTFTKTIKGIYAVNMDGSYQFTGLTYADLIMLGNMYSTENTLFWESIGMVIGSFSADAYSLVFVFENVV